jgi:general secretion pathway protein C
VIWALVAASVVFWALRLGARGPSAPPYTLPVGESPPARGDLSRLLGSGPAASAVAAPPEASSRFRLVGVAAPLASAPQGFGIALVSIDGKPARPFRVGAHVDGDLLLRSVAQRSAAFGPASGATSFTLELPPRPPPATGTLPGLTSAQQSPAAAAETEEPPPREVPEVAPPQPPSPSPQAAPAPQPVPSPRPLPNRGLPPVIR